MDRLTKEEIVAAWNGAVPESKDKGTEMYLHLMQAVADAQYRKCAQSLSQEAVRDEALEEAARVADALTSKWHTDYKIGHGPHRASAHREGMSDGAEEVAREIRSLKREPNAAGGASDE